MEPNNNIHNILFMKDIITDEYGNYYDIVSRTTKGEKVTEVILSHVYYEMGFSRLFTSELDSGYKEFDYIGKPIRDTLKSHIKDLNSSGRKIFTIQELIENGIDVKIRDITKKHPREEKQDV